MSHANAAASDDSLKSLLKQFVDRGLSRRGFLNRLAALGVASGAARSLAADFSAFIPQPNDDQPESLPPWARKVTGTGGKLLVEQLKASGCKYVFTTPSSGEAPIYDALIDEPGIQIIQVLHEGSLAAVADGYGRATGTTPFVLMPRPGLPNAMTQMFNAWKDYTAMVVMVDDVAIPIQAQDGFETVDHLSSMTAPMVKWHWSIETAYRIPEVLRKAFKFATTKPKRPVFLACPEDLFAQEATAAIIDQHKYDVSTELRPSIESATHIAELLVKARNPLIYAGDDVRYCHAEAQLFELANMLSIPVVNDLNGWSRNFPTDHPLYAGRYSPTARYPGDVDVLLHLGSRFQYGTGRTIRLGSRVKLIQVGLDSTGLARNFPVELAVVADVRLALIDVIAEARRMSPQGFGAAVSARLELAKTHQKERRVLLDDIRQRRWNDSPPSAERICAEIDAALPRDALIVSEGDSYRVMVEYTLPYGPDGRDLYATAGGALGWGLPAAFGVKLAQPQRPVIAILSDGSFLFSGPQALWTYSRYRAPITVIVLNNHSYNGERNRILMARGRGYETGRDMVCYLGDPQIQFAKFAAGFGVPSEEVKEPNELVHALARAQQANAAGKPYLLDVHVQRTGSLSTSTWHPEFHIPTAGNS